MRFGVWVVMASVSVAAQQSPVETPLPQGVDIAARDGDRILLDDDARVQIVRRRQSTVRAIYNQRERALIVLADHLKPGEFPDGIVDWVFNFYNVEGPWPLGERWEALTSTFQFERERSRPAGLAFETPRGLVQVVPRGLDTTNPGSAAVAVMTYNGSSSGPRRGWSFAEAESFALNDAARSRNSNATVSTVTPPPGPGPTRTGTVAVQAASRKAPSPPSESNETYYSYLSQSDRTPPPVGQEIAANDGDRVIVDDDARIQVIRRRHGTIRTIFDQPRRLLIVLADYSGSGRSPDGKVDWAFNLYDVEGSWPLGPRWEAVTTIFQYEGDQEVPGGYALATPQGLVHLSSGRPGLQKPEPIASAVLWFRGSSTRVQPGQSFAGAEQDQLSQAAERTRAR